MKVNDRRRGYTYACTQSFGAAFESSSKEG